MILQKLFPNLKIKNLSNSDDTKVLQHALGSAEKIIDIGHAGTAMRFLTSYFSVQNDIKLLTGSKRMKQRPIKVLVQALRQLGSSIEYVNKDGFPPLEITGKKLVNDTVSIAGNISSQYISALLLIAPSLPNGLVLNLEGEITSVPYIKMTLALLNSIGVEYAWTKNSIQVFPKAAISKHTSIVEPDWSSASYYYSLVSLQPNSEIELLGFRKESLQGDSVLQEIYTKLGVETTFTDTGIVLKNTAKKITQAVEFDLANTPDIAQTIAVTCFGLGIECCLTGLHTLKIKETDRLIALKTELTKLGGKVKLTSDSIQLFSRKEINLNILITTYQDHRMAMAFAPLSVLVPIAIENPSVVSKSYPSFWEDFESCF